MKTSPWLFLCERVQHCGVQPPALPLHWALPSRPQSLYIATTTLLLPWHSSWSKEISARYFYFWFSRSCVRREWLQSKAKQSMRWINCVKPQCCCYSYWWIIWSFCFVLFSFCFFFSPPALFFFFLFPATRSQSPQAWFLHPVLPCVDSGDNSQ